MPHRRRLYWLFVIWLLYFGAPSRSATEAVEPSPRYELIAHRDDATPAEPTAAERRRGFQLFRRHWMNAVFSSTVPPRDERLFGLKDFASPGEFEPIAFGLHALRDLDELSLSATPLKSAENQLPPPELYVARNLLVAVRHSQAPQVLEMPVVLERRRRFTASAATSRFCWVTLHIPPGTPAGTYRGEITVTCNRRTTVRIPVTLRVLPIRLLPSSELEQSYGFWTWHFEAPPAYAPDPLVSCRDMVAHGFNSV